MRFDRSVGAEPGPWGSAAASETKELSGTGRGRPTFGYRCRSAAKYVIGDAAALAGSD